MIPPILGKHPLVPFLVSAVGFLLHRQLISGISSIKSSTPLEDFGSSTICYFEGDYFKPKVLYFQKLQLRPQGSSVSWGLTNGVNPRLDAFLCKLGFDWPFTSYKIALAGHNRGRLSQKTQLLELKATQTSPTATKIIDSVTLEKHWGGIKGPNTLSLFIHFKTTTQANIFVIFETKYW